MVLESANLAGLTQLTHCTNLAQLGRLLILDTWIDVLDRRKPDGTWNILIDQSTSRPSFVAIDQGLSLSESLRPRGAVVVGDPGISLRFPQELLPYVDWNEAHSALQAVEALPSEQLRRLLDSLPPEWDISSDDKANVIEYLFERRPAVRQLVEQEGRGR